MDQNNPLTLVIDDRSGPFLYETARWAKFLSIVGFILCGLMVIIGFFASAFLSTIAYSSTTDVPFKGFTTLVGFIYVFIALIYFFPCLFLYRFADKAKAAFHSNDQELLNTSLFNLRRLFKFMGIFTIIILSLYALIFIFGGLAAAFLR